MPAQDPSPCCWRTGRDLCAWLSSTGDGWRESRGAEGGMLALRLVNVSVLEKNEGILEWALLIMTPYPFWLSAALPWSLPFPLGRTTSLIRWTIPRAPGCGGFSIFFSRSWASPFPSSTHEASSSTALVWYPTDGLSAPWVSQSTQLWHDARHTQAAKTGETGTVPGLCHPPAGLKHHAREHKQCWARNGLQSSVPNCSSVSLVWQSDLMTDPRPNYSVILWTLKQFEALSTVQTHLQIQTYLHVRKMNHFDQRPCLWETKFQENLWVLVSFSTSPCLAYQCGWCSVN